MACHNFSYFFNVSEYKHRLNENMDKWEQLQYKDEDEFSVLKISFNSIIVGFNSRKTNELCN